MGSWLGLDRTDLSEDMREAMRMHPVTLHFADVALELKFQAGHFIESLPLIRLFLVSAAILYALFGLLDYEIAPNDYATFWAIRYGFICPSMLVIWGLTYVGDFSRWAQPLLASFFLVTGLGILAMTAVGGSPAREEYYAGLIMVLIYGAALVRLDHIDYSLSSLFLIGCYQVVAIALNPIEPSVLLANDYYLAMALLVGMLTSYFLEVYVRQGFCAIELLTRDKREAERLQEIAESANRAKTAFLTIMSHELRTPLNAVIGFSDIMRQQLLGPVGSERYRSFAEDIHSSGTNLLDIINAILDLARAEAGELKVEDDDIDLRGILREVDRAYRDQAAAGGVRLSIEAYGEQYHVSADRRLLRKAVANLTNNGIKFTGRGGEVILSIVADGEAGTVGIRVADSGVGIAKEDLGRILNPFVQADGSLTRQYQGIGLGLPLVARIAALHHASLDIKSEVGIGTTVTLWFPASRVATLYADLPDPPQLGRD
jgi:signal transduction histidine kinase